MSREGFRDIVDVRVVRHLALGLYVKLNDGGGGIVRVRELSWEKDRSPDWKTRYPIGWKGKAFRLPSREGELTEFSLRLIEDDPWDDLSEKTDLDKTFEGVVTGVVEYGAFIEIAPGVTGLLHRSQLPKWAKGSPIEVFWPGDRVKVVAREIKRKERRVSLGLAFVPELTQTGEKDRASANLNATNDTTLDIESFLKPDAPKFRFLVVEDEREQSAAIANWLRRLGQLVDVVETAEQALDFLERSQPDLALMDVGLPGMDGIRLADIALERWPSVHVVSMTDWARADDRMDELDALQERGAELLIKPILPEDLMVLLKNPADGKNESQKTEAGQLTLNGAPILQTGNTLQDLLNQCKNRLGFDAAILFGLDPAQRALRIIERAGEAFIEKSAIPMLVYSPVRDVAEDRKEIAVDDMRAASREQFRYLLEMTPWMEACIGVPVPLRSHLDYALFVLDARPRAIKPEQKMIVEATALMTAAWLERNKFMEQSALIQRTALIGHLTRAMVHEINNLVGPLSSRLDELQSAISRMEKDGRSTRTASLSVEEIQKRFKMIVNVTRMFRRVVAKGRNEILVVDEIIRETMDLLRDSGDRAHIRLSYSPPQKLVVIRNQAASLEQVLLNLMLNAVQQIEALREGLGGWMRIWTESFTNPGGADMLRILIEDNGPGIHARLWEKVFEAGYSTRPDGSGIGLFISRNLIHEMGGKIYVRESFILGGTTFAVEIPR